MKPLLLALALSLPALPALAGVPAMTLPDLVFPAPKPLPDLSTRGCVATAEVPCR